MSNIYYLPILDKRDAAAGNYMVQSLLIYSIFIIFSGTDNVDPDIYKERRTCRLGSLWDYE